MSLAISVGRDYNTARVERHEFPDFAALTEFVRLGQPEGGFTGPYLCAPMLNGHRSERDALPTSVIALDFDRLEPEAPRRLCEAMEYAGWRALTWTTRKSTPEAPRLRIVCELDRPVAKPEYASCYRGIVRHLAEATGLALVGDPLCERPEQPAVLPQPASELWAQTEGAALDVDAFIAFDPGQQENGQRNKRPHDDAKTGEGGRNNLLSRRAFQMRKVGCSVEEIEAALLVANEQRCDPPLPEDEVRGVARRKAKVEPDPDQHADHPDEPALPRHPLAWRELKDRAPAPRAWAVQDWLPMGTAALLAGRGGIGKTLLAQTIGTCLVGALNYFADTQRPLRVLMWAGEDDHDELWRRQIDICNWAGIGIEEIDGKLILQSYASQDITLAGLAFGKFGQTPIMEELREQIHDYRAEYVFLDSVARIYGGNENDRHQVTTFISWLTAACGAAGVCLLGHPGKAHGAEYSGSTAWEGSVRARLYLGDRLPDAQLDDEDDDPADDTIRYLARRKANYSAKDWVKLEYRNGVLMPDRSAEYAPFGMPSAEYQKDTVLRAVRTLAERSIYGNASTRSGDYLPRLAKQYKLIDRMNDKQFTAVMRQLILEGRLISTEVGKYANRTPRMGLKAA